MPLAGPSRAVAPLEDLDTMTVDLAAIAVVSFNIAIACFIIRLVSVVPPRIRKWFTGATRFFDKQNRALDGSLSKTPAKLDRLTQLLFDSNRGWIVLSQRFSSLRGLWQLQRWLSKRSRR